MISFVRSLCVCCLVPAAAAGSSIEGRVTLPRRHSAPVLNQRYEIVARGGILATNPPLAIVWFERAAGAPPAGSATAEMAQRNLEFEPALLPVRVGTRVYFPNKDETYHNIFSYSPAKRFDLGRYRADETPVPSVLFDTAGLVTLHCDIHEHMRALILVVATPWFAVSQPDGGFRLENLPAGPGKLSVWLDSRTTRERSLTLPAKGSVRVEFP